MEPIFHTLLTLGGVAIVFKYWCHVMNGEIPQGPAAVGRAVAAPSLILAFCLVVLHFVQLRFVSRILEGVDLYLVLSPILALGSCVLAGWVAARTTEDTQLMNVKIVAAMAFLPFLLISLVSLSWGPPGIIWGVIALYIPSLYAGYRFYLKYA